jgi:orotidine-5'-phosphate decarboxylase
MTNQGETVAALAKFDQRAQQSDSLLCVGLDSAIEKLPASFRQEENPQFAFNRWIIEQTHSYVSAYKPNIAFYEARGDNGLRDLKLTMEYLHERHPDILTICDAKRGDNGNSNKGYASAIFDWLGFDAVTLQPYMGGTVLRPFLERADKGCIILCRNSNAGAGELQDLDLAGKPLWQIVAESVRDRWNTNGNCMLVVGATVPDELRQVRALVDDMPLLAPGIGAQGADLNQAVHAGLNADGRGLILNASRSVIFAGTPGATARTLRDQINQYR